MNPASIETKATSLPRRTLAAAAVLCVIFLTGCSHTNDPQSDDGMGSLNVHLDLSASRAVETVSAGAAQPVVDSMVVLVFRGGAGATLEAARGVAVDGSTTDASVRVRCLAEPHKKVAVQLFDGGIMTYFGVDEDVTVKAYQNTVVTVDAVDIRIDAVTIAPVVVAEYEPVSLSWDGARAAAAYGVQESRTKSFDSVVWETLTTDTLLLLTRGLGAHYFRVAPLNQYTAGSFSDVAYCYVASATELPPSISSVTPPAAPPGALATVRGVNLDLPGSRIFIGNQECHVVSSQENEMVIRIPLTAITGQIFLSSILGDCYGPGPFVVERIAVVTGDGTGSLVHGYIPLILADPGIVYNSGVDVVTVDEIDGRDMSVFDLIVLAGDTGDLGGNWGNDPGRAQAIAASGAQVLAIGTGGAEFLLLTNSDFTGRTVNKLVQEDLYVPDVGLLIFSSPYQIPVYGGGMLNFCAVPEQFVAFQVPAGPVSSTLTLYASYEADHSSYALMDSRKGSGLNSVVNFFWGYDGDPAGLAPPAQGFLLNVISMLMGIKPSTPELH